jgi:hypothetical protein
MLEETGTPAESPLPPAILRGLGDRSYDKRKTAALDVTALIKSLQEAGGQIHLKCIRNNNDTIDRPIVSYSILLRRN